MYKCISQFDEYFPYDQQLVVAFDQETDLLC